MAAQYHSTAEIARSVDGDGTAPPTREQLGRHARFRRWIDQWPHLRRTYRVIVGVLGGLIAVIGLILVPLPGPGWLVVFLGLAVLGTEFHFARRLLAWLRRTLDRFWVWWRGWRAARRERRTTR